MMIMVVVAATRMRASRLHHLHSAGASIAGFYESCRRNLLLSARITDLTALGAGRAGAADSGMTPLRR